MNSLEAITRLIQFADDSLQSKMKKLLGEGRGGEEVPVEDMELGVAISITNAILNAALPIAKYRCFVEIDKDQDKAVRKLVKTEFTVCGASMSAIKSGIASLLIEPINARVMIFVQLPHNSDMITAYQGKTKSKQYRDWLIEIDKYDLPAATIQ